MLQDAPLDDSHDANQDPAPSEAAFKPLELTFSSNPTLLTKVQADVLPPNRPTNFFRSAAWCPDGSCILSHEEDRLAKIFSLPPEMADLSVAQADLQPYMSMSRSPAALLGLQWYTFAHSHRPETFCFLRSCRDVPVALIDGYTGKIRASYSIIDHQERFIGPQCMTFSLDGMKVYCGFESAIECFDIANPGATGTRFQTSPSRKSRQGQKGLISSIAFCPDQSGLMAAGSYGRSVHLYDSSGGEPRLIRSLNIKQHKGSGVTQVKFHPTSPEILYTASRCSNEILVWDTRNTKHILQSYARKGNTNQRIEFDIDAQGKWLTTGDTDGKIHFFDTQSVEDEPAHAFKLCNDTVSSAALHPYLACLLTSSGTRVRDRSAGLFSDNDSDAMTSSSSSSEDSDSKDDTSGSGESQAMRSTMPSAITLESPALRRQVGSLQSSQVPSVHKATPSSRYRASYVKVWKLV